MNTETHPFLRRESGHSSDDEVMSLATEPSTPDGTRTPEAKALPLPSASLPPVSHLLARPSTVCYQDSICSVLPHLKYAYFVFACARVLINHPGSALRTMVFQTLATTSFLQLHLSPHVWLCNDSAPITAMVHHIEQAATAALSLMRPHFITGGKAMFSSIVQASIKPPTGPDSFVAVDANTQWRMQVVLSAGADGIPSIPFIADAVIDLPESWRG